MQTKPQEKVQMVETTTGKTYEVVSTHPNAVRVRIRGDVKRVFHENHIVRKFMGVPRR